MEIKEEFSEQKLNYIFENFYFRINKNLLLCTGLWPYQHWLIKIILRVAPFLIVAPGFFPLIHSCRKWCGDDLDICNENISSILILSSILLKYLATIFSEKKLIIIYREIARHWYEIRNPQEVEILVHYAAIGRRKTIVYLVYLMTSGVLFPQVSMIPVILDVILPRNESRPKVPILKWQLDFDLDKYFYAFYTWFLVGGIVVTSTVVAIDTIFTTAVHQFLGLLSIVKLRLDMATRISGLVEDRNYNLIISAIHLHKESLQLSKTYQINSKFTQLYAKFLENSRLTVDLLRILGMMSIVTVHVLYITLSGQKIIDYSTDIFTATYMTKWYNMSKKSKQLLRIVMLRCLRPCIFTAGKLYIMHVENFGAIIRKSISCVAVLNSISS